MLLTIELSRKYKLVSSSPTAVKPMVYFSSNFLVYNDNSFKEFVE